MASQNDPDATLVGGQRPTTDDLVQRAAGLRERAGVLGDYL
jgi:hypothetical protein